MSDVNGLFHEEKPKRTFITFIRHDDNDVFGWTSQMNQWTISMKNLQKLFILHYVFDSFITQWAKLYCHCSRPRTIFFCTASPINQCLCEAVKASTSGPASKYVLTDLYRCWVKCLFKNFHLSPLIIITFSLSFFSVLLSANTSLLCWT